MISMATSYNNVNDKICKMTLKGIQLKSKGFFSISYGVLEIWRKIERGGGGGANGLDRIKNLLCEHF